HDSPQPCQGDPGHGKGGQVAKHHGHVGTLAYTHGKQAAGQSAGLLVNLAIGQLYALVKPDSCCLVSMSGGSKTDGIAQRIGYAAIFYRRPDSSNFVVGKRVNG